MAIRGNSEVGRLADQLERSFHGGAWHGPATREALADIDAAGAERRLAGSSHTIVELVRHITFWLNAAYLRITGGNGISDEADWPEEKTLTDEAWIQTVTELDLAHANLHTALLNLDDNRLEDAVAGSDPTVRGLLLGTLQHNAYHTGQIVQITRELPK
jgi:uncharacterized damage-inducible protein DinB